EPDHRHCRLLRARRERPHNRRAAECGQQFPPSDGDCHTPLPREVRRGKNTTPRARCLHVVLREPPWTAGGQKCSQLFLVEHGARRGCLHVVLREPPWTAGGQKCSQLFLVEHGARRGMMKASSPKATS